MPRGCACMPPCTCVYVFIMCVCACVYVSVNVIFFFTYLLFLISYFSKWHMPLISGERKYAFSANASGSDNTWMGDRLGMQSAVDITYFSFLIFFLFYFYVCMYSSIIVWVALNEMHFLKLLLKNQGN